MNKPNTFKLNPNAKEFIYSNLNVMTLHRNDIKKINLNPCAKEYMPKIKVLNNTNNERKCNKWKPGYYYIESICEKHEHDYENQLIRSDFTNKTHTKSR